MASSWLTTTFVINMHCHGDKLSMQISCCYWPRPHAGSIIYFQLLMITCSKQIIILYYRGACHGPGLAQLINTMLWEPRRVFHSILHCASCKVHWHVCGMRIAESNEIALLGFHTHIMLLIKLSAESIVI